MNAVICLDDNNGIMFNGRRQSRDRVVTEKILDIAKDGMLYMSNYSSGLFEKNISRYKNHGDTFYFIEDGRIPYELINRVYIFRWNRVYPADKWVDMDYIKSNFNLVYSEDIEGYSHKRITLEVYERF